MVSAHLFFLSITGRGTAAEACGYENVFPSDDLD